MKKRIKVVRISISALLLMWCFITFAQQDKSQWQIQIDSIEDQILVSSDSLNIWHLKSLARLAFNLEDYGLVIDYLHRLRIAATSLGNDRALADAYHSWSDLHLDMSRFEESLLYADTLLKHASKSEYPKRISQAYNHMGIAHRFLGNYSEARKAYLKAAEVNERYQLIMDLGFGYNNIGSLARNIDMHDKALFYFDKVREVAARLEDDYQSHWLETISRYGKASVHFNQQKYHQALKDFAETLELNNSIPGPSLEYTRIRSLSYMARCHLALDSLDQAEEGFRTLMADHNYPLAVVIDAVAKNALGEVYMKQGKWDLAGTMIREANNLAHQVNYKEVLAGSYQNLSTIYAQQKSFARAHGAEVLAGRYRDSLLNDEKLKAFARMEMEFDTKEKEQEIHNLTQQNQIKNLWLIIIITGLGIIVVITLLLWRLSRIQKLKNHQIEHQRQVIEGSLHEKEKLLAEKNLLIEEKDLLMSEIHHRVKNNLLILETLLTTQSGHLKNQEAISVINKNRGRLESIRLIHQQLFEAGSTISSIEVNQFLNNLTIHLRNALPANVDMEFRQSEGQAMLDVQRAVALGIAFNEIITNSIKYAFPNGRAGRITVRLQIHWDCTELIVSDDGIGLPKAYIGGHSQKSGLSLIRGLTRQLGGKIQIDTAEGTMYCIHFTPDIVKSYLEPEFIG